MTVYVSDCIVGLFAIQNGKVLAYELFSKDPEVIAKRMTLFELGEEISELKNIEARLKGKGVRDLVTTQPNPASEFLKENFRQLAIEYKFVKDQSELNKILSEVSVARTKTSISKLEKRDKLIIQAVSLIGDLDRMLNGLTERLREWYGLHYPELRVIDHLKYIKKVEKYGRRNSFEDFTTSMGMELRDDDVAILQKYAVNLAGMYDLREKTESYLNKIVPEEMPNMAALLGNVLAARLLAQAGSLERVAKMSSSTIQLLGAEKSLFKFLKDRTITKPPKFGVIFLHPDISTARKEQQGRIARLLAAKLTIAARADFYSKENLSKILVEDYKRRLELIRQMKL